MQLATYLSRTEIKPATFAASLGVPASTVHRWLSGERVPRLAWLARIEKATKGAVTANDFMPEPTAAKEQAVAQ